MIYLGGIVTGFILMFVFAFLISLIQIGHANDDDQDVVLLEKPQQVIDANSLAVIQVLSGGNALATIEDTTYYSLEKTNNPKSVIRKAFPK